MVRLHLLVALCPAFTPHARSHPVSCPALPNVAGVATATHAEVVAVASPVFVVLCWIRSFRYLAFTSILGDVAFVLAMGASSAEHCSPPPPRFRASVFTCRG